MKLRLDQHQTGGRTLRLKVKFSDYQQITRSKTVLTPIRELSAIRVASSVCAKRTLRERLSAHAEVLWLIASVAKELFEAI